MTCSGFVAPVQWSASNGCRTSKVPSRAVRDEEEGEEKTWGPGAGFGLHALALTSLSCLACVSRRRLPAPSSASHPDVDFAVIFRFARSISIVMNSVAAVPAQWTRQFLLMTTKICYTCFIPLFIAFVIAVINEVVPNVLHILKNHMRWPNIPLPWKAHWMFLGEDLAREDVHWQHCDEGASLFDLNWRGSNSHPVQ